MTFLVSALADEEGRIPAPDRNPPIGRVLEPSEVPDGPPLRKVLNSRPFPPKKDEDEEDLENRRALP